MHKKIESKENEINQPVNLEKSLTVLNIYEEYLFKINLSYIIIIIGILDLLIAILIVMNKNLDLQNFILLDLVNYIYAIQLVIFIFLSFFSYKKFSSMGRTELVDGRFIKKYRVQYLIALLLLFMFKFNNLTFVYWILPIDEFIPIIYGVIFYPGLGLLFSYILIRDILKNSGFKELLISGLLLIFISIFLGIFFPRIPNTPFNILKWANQKMLLEILNGMLFFISGIILFFGARKTLGLKIE